MKATRKPSPVKYDDTAVVAINGYQMLRVGHLEMTETQWQKPTLMLAVFPTSDGPEFEFSVGARYDIKVIMKSGRTVWDRNMSLLQRWTVDDKSNRTTVWLHFE